MKASLQIIFQVLEIKFSCSYYLVRQDKRMGNCVCGKSSDSVKKNPADLPNAHQDPQAGLTNPVSLRTNIAQVLPGYRFHPQQSPSLPVEQIVPPKISANPPSDLVRDVLPPREVISSVVEGSEIKRPADARQDARENHESHENHEERSDPPPAPAPVPAPAEEQEVPPPHFSHLKPAPQISDQFSEQILLSHLAEPAPKSDTDALTGTVKDMESAIDSMTLQMGRSKITKNNGFKERSRVDEAVGHTIGALPVVHEESEIVNDQNCTNFSVPINLKFDIRVQ